MRYSSQRIHRAANYRGLYGAVALALSLTACYGTLAAVTVLSALGIVLTLNEAIWAGAIVFFALLATAFVGLRIPRHRSMALTLLALLGTAFLSFVMFVQYDRISELVAFGLLTAAVLLDIRLCSPKRTITTCSNEIA